MPSHFISSRWLLKLDLHRLILMLAVLGVLATFSNSFYAIYQAQRQLLISSTLEANRVYAAKLASTTETMLTSAQGQLAYSATLLASLIQAGDEPGLDREIRRLHEQTQTFNSVGLINAEGLVVSVAPESIPLRGRTLTSRNARQNLAAKQPSISDPFISASGGEYIISLTHPVFSSDRRYLGYVSGTIYLQSASILSSILGRHHYQDGSNLYVVDRHGMLIYHPNPGFIGRRLLDNPVINRVLNNNEGAQAVTTSGGSEMLAGFAPVSNVGWGVVAQRPLTATLAGLDAQMSGVLLAMIPTNLFILFVIWLFATFISRPLRQLANKASLMDQQEAVANIASIRAWYYEAAQLKLAILKGLGLLNTKIDQLHQDSHTDPMTGLYNRRAMQRWLDERQMRPLAIVALDIDHFKQVNDRFGHDVGDAVIITLAALMRQDARASDFLCRSGGEEFLLLLPDTSLAQAQVMAERLREKVASQTLATVGKISISLGIAHWPDKEGSDMHTALKYADKALYEAKHRGRNCVVVMGEY